MADGKSFSHLVVIGSSAGGIDALSTLVATLPADFPAPLVLAQHLDPTRPSHLAEILARRSTLPVRTVVDPEPLEAGVVFVVPSNHYVSIDDHMIELQVEGAGRPKPSIDRLLGTAAEGYGERLIAVILTGMGSDGAAGARAVNQAGGTVIIQNPATASFPAMPQSLAPTTVDIVADLERIGPILHDLVRGGLANGGDAPAREDEERELGDFLAQLRERNGVDFSSYKEPTIRRRLQRRIVAVGARDLRGYRAYLDAHPEEYQQLIASFLIKVTEFFRDPELFAYLRETILPDLIAQADRRGAELRLWSAGCATGEEAYSLAILVSEILGRRLPEYTVRIFATDLDEEAIAFARRGVYAAPALDGLPEDLVARYFTAHDGEYEVRKAVRALVVFGQHDLGQRAPFPRIDLVLCRNVLIYFTQALQRRTLQIFAYSLRDGGYLALGKAESPGQVAELFAPAHPQHTVYRRHGERILMPLARGPALAPLSPSRPPTRARALAALAPPVERPGRRLPTLAESFLLRLPVGAVVVNRRYDIQAINSAARRFLAIHTPAIGEDLIHIAQGVPARELRDAIEATFRTGASAGLDELGVEDVATGERRFLQIICQPQQGDGSREPVEAVLIIVSDITPAVRGRQALEGQLAAGREEAARREARLGRLALVNDQLLAANQELTATNEELRAATEEFLLSTEEAQAAAEEVETLNEEMQATNEELETLNEELQATVEELNTTNDDLQARSLELQELARAAEEERARLEAVLAGMSDAVLVLDRDGRPVLTNDAYRRLFGDPAEAWVARDGAGQPLPPEASPRGRAARGESFEMEFTLEEPAGARRWFEASGRPIREAEGGQRRGVLVLRDVTARRQAEEELRERETRLRILFEQIPAILWTIDPALRFTASVGSGLASLALAPNQIVGQTLAEYLGADATDPIDAHRRALAGESVSYESEVRGRLFRAYVEPLRDGEGRIIGVIGVAHDVTDRSLRRLQEEFIANVSHDLRTPLTAVRAGLGLLAASAGDRLGAAEQGLLQNARRNTERLGRLIDDLVTFNQLRAGALDLEHEPLDLRVVVTDAAAAIHPLTEEKEQTIEADLPDPLPIDGDRRRLEQVLVNLLDNANRYSPPGARIAIAGRADAGEIVLDVRDDGPGIAEADLDRVFARGITGQGGSGLGLTIARWLVELHGGRIWVESGPGAGATFRIALPRGEEASGAAGAAEGGGA